MAIACSTDKNTALRRAYHNTTSRYNGYFNAKEIIKEEEATLRNNFKEDYSQVLPLFIYPDDKQSQALYPQMDKVIEKCSEVIERHSIYKRKTEHIKWIDDSYYLIGKARLYKHEYGLAEQTFLYVYQAYKKDPNRYSGLNWFIRTLIETEQYDRAEEFLDLGEDERGKFPDELFGNFNAIYADYHLKVDQDEIRATEKLEAAVKLTKDKSKLLRYTFILAQLYERQRDYGLAVDRYTRAIKLRPDYEMRFNAKINRAVLYEASSSEGKDIKKELFKMLKDKKNEDFKDQIYYALAKIALKEDDQDLAIDYLRKSIRSSTNNVRQKGLSYLKIANLYFEQPDYVNAQEHFDSTLLYLPKGHPEYWDADSKNNSLIDLVKNLKLISKEDSLLALSNLSDKEKSKKVEEIIAQIKKEEERKKQAQLKKLKELQNGNNNGLIDLTASPRKGDWYFYNATTLSLGRGEFQNLWGTRNLEDHWRRKNKKGNTILTNNSGGNLEQDDPESIRKDSLEKAQKYNPEFYLKDIPKDVKEQLQAHGRIAEALFNVGTIFKESFNDYQSAIKAFERIINQYDTSQYNLPAHYQLYRIYTITELDDKAAAEKAWVLDNHPFSEYAYLIKNPEYIKQKKDSREKVEEFYAATYKLFQYKLYNDVIESCVKADETFSENHIAAKFDLLKAKAIGHIRTKEEFKKSLLAIVEEYPDDPVKDRANDLISYINQMNTKKEEKPKEVKKPAIIYEYKPEEKHLAIISAPAENDAAFNVVKNRLSNFNVQYFREQKLKVVSSALNDNSLYLIRTFPNQALATRYIKALKNNTKLMVLMEKAGAQQYLISTPNFSKLFKSKAEEEYIKFFSEKYSL